jgi:hypothetical protein
MKKKILMIFYLFTSKIDSNKCLEKDKTKNKLAIDLYHCSIKSSSSRQAN